METFPRELRAIRSTGVAVPLTSCCATLAKLSYQIGNTFKPGVRHAISVTSRPPGANGVVTASSGELRTSPCIADVTASIRIADSVLLPQHRARMHYRGDKAKQARTRNGP